MAARHPKAGTYLLLIGGMALFGSATPVSKIVGAVFPAVLASALRMLIGAVVLLPLLIRRSASLSSVLRDLDRRDWLLLSGIAAIGTFGFTLLLLFGLRLVAGSVGAIVMATTPAVTAAGAIVFLHDSLDRWKGLGLALGVAGVLVVNAASSGGASGGGLLLVGAVVCGLGRIAVVGGGDDGPWVGALVPRDDARVRHEGIGFHGGHADERPAAVIHSAR